MSTPAFTPEQARAIELRGVSIALDAGAGCGKTFVLTERYLAHLPPDETPDIPAKLDEVVAITFTTAAAREMRDRIRRKCFDRLQAAGEGPGGDYWLRMIRSLDAARISTIDSFCQTLLRSAAPQLGIDPLFRVLDEASAPVLLSEVTDRVLRAAIQAGDERVAQLAVDLELNKLRSAVGALVAHRHSPAFATWLAADEAACIARWRELYETQVLGAIAATLLASDPVREIRRLLPLAQPRTTVQAELFSEISVTLDDLAHGVELDQSLPKLRELCFSKPPGENQFRWTAKDWPSSVISKEFTDACTKVRKQLVALTEPPSAESLRFAARQGLDLLALAGQIAEAYTAAKLERNALDFADLLAGARRILTEPELAAVKDEQTARIRLLLVDEFQDTSQAQVDLVLGLVGEQFDSGGLFFVGDFKQSIYRFRGAQPEVFRQLQQQVVESGRLPLSENFRSQPGVIEFVNALFAPEFGPAYQPLRAARSALSAEPKVEFLWTTRADGPAPGGAGGAEADRRVEAASIAGRIHELIASGAPLVQDRGAAAPRAVRPGDVAILFRAMNSVHLYEQALRDADLPYYTVGGRAFYAQQEIHDVQQLLECVASHSNDIALAGLLRSPFFALKDETLLAVNELAGNLSAGLFRGSLSRLADPAERDRAAHAKSVLTELRGMLGAASTAAIIERAFARTGYDAALLAEFLGERKWANIRKLVELARQNDAAGGDTNSFLRQLREFTSDDPKEALAATTDSAADVVRLMTIHQSKGLEFPVVFIADLDPKPRGHSPSVLFDAEWGPLVSSPDSSPVGLNWYRELDKQREAEEVLRVFYVACTRAADFLILSATLSDPDQPQGRLAKILARQFELSTGAALPHVDGGAAVRVEQRTHSVIELERGGPRGLDLSRALLHAREAEPSELPRSAFPVSVDPASQHTFSVSRLTGKLWRRVEFRGGESLRVNEEIDPLGFGTLVHAVLERLTFTGQEQIPAWCEQLAPLHLERAIESGAQLANELLTKFVLSSRYAELVAAPRVEREVEFLLSWPPKSPRPHALLQGYIDCVHQSPTGEWRIVDYKTNQVSAAEVPQAAKHYALQMAIYALALEHATGAAPEKLILYFLRPGVEFEFPWDPAARAAALVLIETAIAEARAAAENKS